MEEPILITELNDFIFCPASIYFHKLYGSMDKMIYQCEDQLNGTAAHKGVDNCVYSSRKDVLMGTDVYCERYNLIGKIDIFDIKNKTLRERKKKVKHVYDGYIFQVYAQYFSLIEMGYDVDKIEIYSIDDHKTYRIALPCKDGEMFEKFEKVICDMKKFIMSDFNQHNIEKCKHCIYEPACDKTLIDSDINNLGGKDVKW